MSKFYALQKDVFDISKVTVVGEPTITEDGVVTVTSGYSGNCPYVEIPALGDNWEMIVSFNWENPTNRTTETFFRSVRPFYKCFSLGTTGTQIYLWMQDINQTDYNIGFTGITNFTNLLIKLSCKKITDGYLISVLSSNDDGKNWAINKTHTATVAPYICQNALTYQAFIPTQVNAAVTMDLTKFKYSNGTVSFSPTKPTYLLERRKEGFDLSKFTVVGSPTITSNGVASGFGKDNYTTIQQYSLGDKSWKFNMSFTTGATVNAEQWICNSLDATQRNISIINELVNDVPKIRVRCYVYNTSTSSYNHIQGTFNSYANTNYDVAIEYDGSSVYTFICNSETQRVNNAYKASGVNQSILGKRYPTDTAYFANSDLKIDLPSISITVDGKEVFTGAKENYYMMRR